MVLPVESDLIIIINPPLVAMVCRGLTISVEFRSEGAFSGAVSRVFKAPVLC